MICQLIKGAKTDKSPTPMPQAPRGKGRTANLPAPTCQ
jgi:hypothetical protein